MRGLVCAAALATLPPVAGSLWSKAPPGGIVCDGSKKVEASQLNDDYCDCRDGADEPRTSACSWSTVGRPVFVCENKGYNSVTLLSSRVGDGVCDCCDGSDEARGVCRDMCDVVFASARAEAVRLAEEQAAGRVTRAEYVAQHSAALAAAEAESAEARRRVEDLEPGMAALRAAVKRAEDLELEAQKAAVEARDTDFAAALDAALDGATPWEMSCLALELAASCGEFEALLDVVMQSAGLDGAVTDVIDDVEVLSLGLEAVDAWEAALSMKTKAAATTTTTEATDDDVDAAEKAAALTADALTALGEALHLKSLDAAGARTVAVEAARTCRGAPGGQLAKLDTVAIFDWAGQGLAIRDRALALAKVAPLSPENDDPEARNRQKNNNNDPPLVTLPEGDEARAALRDASRALDAARAAIRQAQPKADQPGPADGAFEPLRDRCFEKSIAKYTYKVCPWGQAKQDTTSLGTFAGWSENYTRWKFKNGQYCPGHGSREMIVDLVCGADNDLTQVEETDICRYRAILKTPAACV